MLLNIWFYLPIHLICILIYYYFKYKHVHLYISNKLTLLAPFLTGPSSSTPRYPGIRHPEELSLARHLSPAELKKNFVPQKLNQRRKLYEQSKLMQNGGAAGFNGTPSPRRTPSVPGTPQVWMHMNGRGGETKRRRYCICLDFLH